VIALRLAQRLDLGLHSDDRIVIAGGTGDTRCGATVTPTEHSEQEVRCDIAGY
jgi:hypothetical protein